MFKFRTPHGHLYASLIVWISAIIAGVITKNWYAVVGFSTILLADVLFTISLAINEFVSKFEPED